MSLPLSAQLEALLFVATGPLSVRQLSRHSSATAAEVEAALEELRLRYAHMQSGLILMARGGDVALATSPEFGGLVASFLKEQVKSELTRPQLETLTIIAYRAPVCKTELEMIRGVNCSLIVRNLLLRGLIVERTDTRLRVPVYEPSFEFLRHLGVSSLAELPQYEELRAHQDLEEVLGDSEEES